ncbi:MAG TPA: SpoIIE family protein phosphatase [Egibacteraceae bacterium]
MLDGAPVGVAVVDADCRVLRANPALAELLGRRPADVAGRRWHDLVTAEDRASVDAVRAGVDAGDRPPRAVQRWQRAGGLAALVAVTATACEEGMVLFVQPADEAARGEGRWRDAGPAVAAAAMQEAAAALGDAVTLDQVTAVMEQQVLAAFDADGLLISLVEGPRLRLVTAHGYERPAVVALSDVPLDDSAPLAEVVQRRVPLFFGSREDYVRAYPDRAEVAALSGKRAWAVLPLIAGARPIGAWALSFARAREFPVSERALLITLSGLLAQALARAQVLHAERALARALQSNLLPAQLPSVAGVDVAVRYRPAGAGAAVGGDFYDVVHVPDERVAIVVGDVQGHSAEAAAVMGQVRSALRAYAVEGHDAATVVALANRFVIDASIDRFVTCAYADVAPDEGAVRLVRAGHVPPLRLRDGRATLLETAGGLPLGVTAAASYEAVDVQLASGDLLLLFTDGLVETRAASLDAGCAELAARAEAAAGQSLESFADDVLRGDPTREDDVALVVLAYRGGAEAGTATAPGRVAAVEGRRSP